MHVKPYVISSKISSFLLGCFIISPMISLKSSVSIQVVLPVHFNVWDILLDTTVQIDLYHAKKNSHVTETKVSFVMILSVKVGIGSPAIKVPVADHCVSGHVF